VTRNRVGLRIRLGIVAVLGLGILTACGDNPDSAPSGVGGSLDSAHYENLRYDGNVLHCVTYMHGISCDWVRYHAENPK
jgi:hypothetical protein